MNKVITVEMLQAMGRGDTLQNEHFFIFRKSANVWRCCPKFGDDILRGEYMTSPERIVAWAQHVGRHHD